jgi:hypothetical protein
VAQSLYSHKELERKNGADLQELIFAKGQNWNDYPAGCKRGRVIVKKEILVKEGVIRNKWVIEAAPIFSQEKDFFTTIFPEMK